MMERWERNLNALQALIIASVLFGAFAIQFFKHETPCPLCLLQRIGMIGLATGALMNCRFGPSKYHYGISLLFCVFGGFVALRQIALHVCPDFPTFGHPFWGLSLYTWSFILFASSVAYISLLLMIFDHSKPSQGKMSWFCYVAFAAIFIAAFANIFTTFAICGFSPCTG